MNGADDWVGEGVGLAALTVLVGRARSATSSPDSIAPLRSELERAVRTGFAPGLVALIARKNYVDVMNTGTSATNIGPAAAG